MSGRSRYNAKGNPKIDVQDEGTTILTALLTALNFAGAGVVVTEGAAGEAIITIAGGGGGGGNQRYYILGSHNVADGSFDVLRLTSNGQVDVGFAVPDDFASLNSVEVMCIPTGIAGAANIDLVSQYAAEGENKLTHTETDNTSTFPFLVANQLTALDLSSVFTSLAVGDYAGCNLDANAIGITLNMIAVKLDYNKV